MTTQTPFEEAVRVSDSAWKALTGAYDLQTHVAPDVIARRIDDIDCAKEFLTKEEADRHHTEYHTHVIVGE